MTQRQNYLTPFLLGMDMWRIGMEAQAVIALRTAGMMGLWATRPAEMTRMVHEKPTAALDAWFAAGRAFMGGAAPQAVMRAGLKPIGKKTGANMRRLGRLGPRSIGG